MAVAGATRAWSLTRRLTVLYVATTAALSLPAAGYLYWVLERNLDARDHALLASKVQVLRLLLRDHPQKTELLANEVEHEASESPLRYFLRVLDERTGQVLETPGMNERLPVDRFPAAQAASDEAPNRAVPEAVHHGTFLLLSVRAPLGRGPETRVLQTALDISTDLALLADYRRRLLVVLGVGLGLAAAAGAWAARTGVRPLTDITRQAQQVRASHLYERIGGAHWPSELADLVAAFNAMLDRLEDSFTRLSQFSGDLAHALRTPINNLRGEAEVALARSRTPVEYQQVLASSLEEFQRLSRMIEDLLFMARADNPKAAIQRVRFDARAQLEAVREFYSALAAERGVAVSCAGEAWVEGDAMLFRRAVSNLLGNALRYTPAQGQIQLEVCAHADQAVELTVRDNGTGIPAEHLSKVFDRFYRVDHADARHPGGAGLGLAIVQSIMRLHGGSARVTSREGQGTTFTLSFPGPSAPAPNRQMTKL